MTKVSIIGAGFVGSTAAYVLAMKGLVDEVALIDILANPAAGKALDIYEATGVFGLDVKINGGGDYSLIKNSDVVVITAGVPRKPEQKREDTLAINAKIMKEVIANVKRHAPDAILVVVSNPLDAMTYLAARESGFPKRRVMGMAGTLDTARFKTFISEATGKSPGKIDAIVLGSHGDLMVPLSRLAAVDGLPLRDILDEETIRKLEERTRFGGAEIVNLLGTGSAYFAVGAAIYEVLEAIFTESTNSKSAEAKKMVPVSAWLDGEYGLSGLFLGVPCRLGRQGVEEVVELDLNGEELSALQQSGESIKKLVEKSDSLYEKRKDEVKKR